MTNLLMKRRAWLRAMRMLAVWIVMLGAMATSSSYAQVLRCGCDLLESNLTVTMTIEDCPVIITYDKYSCRGENGGPVIFGVYIKKIEFPNTGCCIDLYKSHTVAELVQMISAEFMAQNPAGFTPGMPIRVSKDPCWKKSSTTTANILIECSTGECCWIEGQAGSSYTSTGRTFATPPLCGTTDPDCQYVCE